MTRRVCVVTGSRAEYGLLRPLIQEIQASRELALQLVVTGMHLSHEFGHTVDAIRQDCLEITDTVEMLLSSDTPVAIASSVGVGLIGFAGTLQRLAPDILVVLGDRFEILPPVIAALVAKIPVAHVAGGELSEGAFDDSIRHSVTKMSHLHFAATEAYRARVIQMGEDPSRVFNVGGLAADAIRRVPLLDREALESALGLTFGQRNLLVTFHPVTLDANSSTQFAELLRALEELDETRLVFTLPNADPGGRELIEMVNAFVARHPTAKAFGSLGQQKYLSCLQFVDGVVGNSSSGLGEVPTFRKGTINIGDRQQGRERADSVIDCAPDHRSISAAIRRLYSTDFQAGLPSVRNPYGDGGASERIVSILSAFPLGSILKKKFHDLAA